jgi:DNA-binding Lrp family transcriptional regulator
MLQSPSVSTVGSSEMIRAYVLVTATAGKAQHVADALRGSDGVVLVDAITGEYDVIAQVEAADVPGIGRLILDRIQSADGVVKTITCLAV